MIDDEERGLVHYSFSQICGQDFVQRRWFMVSFGKGKDDGGLQSCQQQKRGS